MEYSASIEPSSLAKDFTGLFLTNWKDGLWILKFFEDGNLSDYVDDIDPEADSIDRIISSYFSCIEDDAYDIELYVDNSIIDEFERNLEEFPFEDIDLFPDEDDDDYLLTPEEREKIKEEREEEAEDAFTRFCDH